MSCLLNVLNINIHQKPIDKLFPISSNSLHNIPPGELDMKIQFDNLNSDIFKKTSIIGQGGSIFQTKLNAPLNLSGDTYVYMCIPEFKGQMITSSDKIINNSFAKVFLPGEINQTLYNTFTSGIKIFNEGLLNRIESIEICFINDNKNLFDFNGLNHSFSIEIFELVDDI